MTDAAILPVPDFTTLDATFGARGSTYLTREQMGDEFYSDRNVFTNHVQGVFFRGGSILPPGRVWRPGIDRQKASLAIRAWLCSFEPKHEIKIGTVGYALSVWTQPGTPDGATVTPHQAQRKKAKHKPKGKGRAFSEARQ